MRPFAVSTAAAFRCQVGACALCSAQVWQFHGRSDRYKSEGLAADVRELRDMRPISGRRRSRCHGHSALSRQPEALQIRRRSVSGHRFFECRWNPSTSQTTRWKLIVAVCIACDNVHVTDDVTAVVMWNETEETKNETSRLRPTPNTWNQESETKTNILASRSAETEILDTRSTLQPKFWSCDRG